MAGSTKSQERASNIKLWWRRILCSGWHGPCFGLQDTPTDGVGEVTLTLKSRHKLSIRTDHCIGASVLAAVHIQRSSSIQTQCLHGVKKVTAIQVHQRYIIIDRPLEEVPTVGLRTFGSRIYPSLSTCFISKAVVECLLETFPAIARSVGRVMVIESPSSR